MSAHVKPVIINAGEQILGENSRLANENRLLFEQHGIYALNMISSPGSGKTTLLVETLKALKGEFSCAVIEGDQQTDCDARRIAETGVPVVQVNTGQACHLDAGMVGRALQKLPLEKLDLLFIENVGNLICPAEFDLGENAKVVLMSVTEGEEKPLKYPLIFHLARALVLTKVDLLPHLRFDIELCIRNARRVNPGIELIHTSAFIKEHRQAWLAWIRGQHLLVKSDPKDHL